MKTSVSKRLLSLFLVLVTVFCMIPVMTASAADTDAQSAETTGLGDYRDLYVKDGLVALFTAYESTASDTTLTSWTPADYYGVKGYDTYLNPEDYTASLVSANNMVWTNANGYISSHFNGTRNQTASAYLKLTDLMALMQEKGLGTVYSIQTVRQLVESNRISPDYNITYDEASGKYLIDNYNAVKAYGSETGKETFGTLVLNTYYYHSILSSSNFQIGKGFWTQATGVGTANIGFHNSNYYDDVVLRNYYQPGTTTDNGDGTTTTTEPTQIAAQSQADIFIAQGQTMSILEQTVARYSTTTTAEDGTNTYATYYRLSYQFAPYRYKSSSFGKSRVMTAAATTEAATKSTTANVLVGKVARNFSVRVYNIDLSEEQRTRNHFADLLGYYGTNTDHLLTLSEKHFALIAPEFATTVMYKEKYAADGTLTEGFLAAKAEFETSLAAAIEVAEATFVKPTDYDLLYVKDGLVALFSAYNAKASDVAPESWMAVDLEGREGYDDYIAPTAYPLYDNSTHLAWKWENGRLTSYRQSANGTVSNLATSFNFNLDSLGATLGTTYTVQEIYQITDFNQKRPTPVVEIDEEGDYIITNYADFQYDREGSSSYYGPLTYTMYAYHKRLDSNNDIISTHFGQIRWYNASGTAKDSNIFFNTSNYFTDPTSRTYYYMLDGVKTKIGAAVLGDHTWGVMEQSISRLDAGTANAETGKIAISYRFAWQFATSYPGGRTSNVTTNVASDSTELKLLSARVQNIYGVRVYNTVLTEAAIDQNHLADLCAYYGVDASALLEMDEATLALIAAETADIVLYKNKYDANGELTDDFKREKLAFEAELATLIGITLTDGNTNYTEIYVKDGLVALFTAYESKATDAAPTDWAPVNFYGVNGYEDYIDPSTYAHTLTGTWTAKNGAYGTATNAYFSLKTLVQAMGEAAGTKYPDYTVQEVFNMTASPTTPAIYYKDEAGDYIVENYAALNKLGTDNKKSTYGAIIVNFGFYSKASTPSGVKLFNNYLVQIQYHNNSKYTYKDNVNITNEYYGGEKAVYYYMQDVTTTDETTGETVTTPTKTALHGGTAVYASRYPSSVWEQTVCRTLDTAATTEESVVFNHRVAWQFKPYNLNVGKWTGKGTNFTTTNKATLAIFDDLTTHNGKNANVYSTRVYNRALTDAELDQNHFADLLGYYGIAANGLGTLSETALNELATAYSTVALEKNAFDANGDYTEAYYTAKIALQNAVNAAVLEENYSASAAQGNLMDFDGHSFRTSGDYGIRALFSLDKESLVRLERQGVTLLNYGAIMAIGKYNGTTYNESAAALTVTADADGIVTLADGIKGAALTSAADTSFKTLTDDDVATTFAYTTTYRQDSAAAVLSIDMLYRGFAVLEDKNGAVSVAYYDMTEEESAKNSLFSLHKTVIEDYGRYVNTVGMDTFDYIYNVLSKVDETTYNADKRAQDRELAEKYYGFDENNITLTFGALSDTHVVKDSNSYYRGNRLANMMKVFHNTYNVDAILFAGDLTDKLNTESATALTTSVFKTGYQELGLFAEYAAAGNVGNVPLIWTLGNHDRPHIKNAEDVSFTTYKNGVSYTIPAGTTLTEGVLSVFGNTSEHFTKATAGAPTGFRYQNVNGYAFFAVDYTFANAETIKWLDEQLSIQEKLNPDKPIFVTSHMPSTDDSQKAVITECIQKHDNVIYFSGHTHVHMQTYSSITQRDGFVELVLGPGSHGNYGVSGPGYDYCSYEMKQGAVIDVDAKGNVRIRCVDMNFNVEEDGSVTTLFNKGSYTEITAAENPYVLRTAYITHATEYAPLLVAYDSIPRYTDDERYEAPAFAEDATVGVSDVTVDSLKLSIPKASATNVIKYYKITVTDADGNTVKILDKLDSTLSGTKPAATLVSTLKIGSDHICYVPYNENYPDTYVYTLKTSYVLTTKDADGNVIATSDTYYTLTAGASYTVTVTAYDDFGTATQTITGTFTVPAAE